jgi:hypothetical protein
MLFPTWFHTRAWIREQVDRVAVASPNVRWSRMKHLFAFSDDRKHGPFVKVVVTRCTDGGFRRAARMKHGPVLGNLVRTVAIKRIQYPLALPRRILLQQTRVVGSGGPAFVCATRSCIHLCTQKIVRCFFTTDGASASAHDKTFTKQTE